MGFKSNRAALSDSEELSELGYLCGVTPHSQVTLGTQWVLHGGLGLSPKTHLVLVLNTNTLCWELDQLPPTSPPHLAACRR